VTSRVEPVDVRQVLPIDLGGGIVLRATATGDAADAYAVVDAERHRLREWLPWVDATTSVAIERDYLASVEHANALGVGLYATIRERGRFCGFIGLRVDHAHRSAEVGYWLAAHAEGRGIMSSAVTAMIDVGFARYGLHRIELLAALGNVRSRAIAERLGMTFEGVRREAEELATGFVDLVMYAVLAPEWAAYAPGLRRSEQTGLYLDRNAD
jgi:ribosomal-protein-serine acetyltransferase